MPAILALFSSIFLVWISPLRLPKPNVVYGHFIPRAIFRLLGQLPGPALGIFADLSCSFPPLFRLEYVFSSRFRDLLFGFVRIILILF